MTKLFSIPDHMPILSPGGHAKDGSAGACIMEFVSVLAGEKWSDHPATVHSGLGHVARNVNDGISDPVFLQGLAPLAPRFIGTAKYDGSSSGVFMSETTMFCIPLDILDQQLGAWVTGRVVGYLPESLRVKVQPLLAAMAAGRRIPPGVIADIDDALMASGTDSRDQANARVVTHGLFYSLRNNNRASMYQAASHGFFAIAEAEGKGAVAPMLSEWLDEFDRLTGHSMTDTEPEPTGDDKGDDEIATSPAPAITGAWKYASGESFILPSQWTHLIDNGAKFTLVSS